VHPLDARRFAVFAISRLRLRHCGGISSDMARFLRIYLALTLALMIALTGHVSASVKGARDASGQIVICSGNGAVTLYVDDEGQPTTAPHFCPDCVMHLLDAVASPDAMALRPYGGQAFDRIWETPVLTHRVALDAMARAPPAVG
jgi:hypothetical protein